MQGEIDSGLAIVKTCRELSLAFPKLPALASSRAPCLLHLHWRQSSPVHSPSKQQEFAHISEGSNIPAIPRRFVSPNNHLDDRLPPATGSASTSLASPSCRVDSANALRSRSSRCCKTAHCFHLVTHSNNSSTALPGLQKASRSRLGSKQNLPYSGELYRFATAGPVVSAPKTSPRRLGVRMSSMQ